MKVVEEDQEATGSEKFLTTQASSAVTQINNAGRTVDVITYPASVEGEQQGSKMMLPLHQRKASLRRSIQMNDRGTRE